MLHAYHTRTPNSWLVYDGDVGARGLLGKFIKKIVKTLYRMWRVLDMFFSAMNNIFICVEPTTSLRIIWTFTLQLIQMVMLEWATPNIDSTVAHGGKFIDLRILPAQNPYFGKLFYRYTRNCFCGLQSVSSGERVYHVLDFDWSAMVPSDWRWTEELV